MVAAWKPKAERVLALANEGFGTCRFNGGSFLAGRRLATFFA
jgi:hypothetical protein